MIWFPFQSQMRKNEYPCVLFQFFSHCKQSRTLERGETGVWMGSVRASLPSDPQESCQSCRQGLGRIPQDFTADCWWEDVSVCEKPNLLFLPGDLLRLLSSFIIYSLQFRSLTFFFSCDKGLSLKKMVSSPPGVFALSSEEDNLL